MTRLTEAPASCKVTLLRQPFFRMLCFILAVAAKGFALIQKEPERASLFSVLYLLWLKIVKAQLTY